MRAKLTSISSSSLLCWAMLLLAFVPLYNSSTKYQGWGGDYAGYLLETKNIVNGISLSSTNYIYNPGYTELAPPAYPVGFPLLAAGVYRIFGLDILAFTRLSGLFWWLIGVVLFLLLKSRFSNWVAVVAALFFMYHPLFFFGRNAVLSDFPFTLFLLLSAYFYSAPNNSHSLKNAGLVGFLAGYAWLIRSVGFIVPVAIVVHFVLEQWVFRDKQTQKLDKRWWLFPTIVLGTAVGIQIIFHGIFFKLPATGSYFDQINPVDLFGYFKSNITAYTETLVQYFQLNGDLWYIFRYKNTDTAAALGGAIAIGFSIIGLFSVSNRQERFYMIIILAYMTILLFWPSFQGLRFLLPILPFVLYFLLKAIDQQHIGSKWGNNLKWLIIPALYYGEFNRIDRHIYAFSQADEIGSPEWKDNQAAYQYARDSVPSGAIFGYHHPLIFALYAEKPVMRWVKTGTPQALQADFEKFKVQYLLLNDWLVEADEPMKNYLKENSNRLDTIWHNERNVLYKFK